MWLLPGTAPTCCEPARAAAAQRGAPGRPCGNAANSHRAHVGQLVSPLAESRFSVDGLLHAVIPATGNSNRLLHVDTASSTPLRTLLERSITSTSVRRTICDVTTARARRGHGGCALGATELSLSLSLSLSPLRPQRLRLATCDSAAAGQLSTNTPSTPPSRTRGLTSALVRVRGLGFG